MRKIAEKIAVVAQTCIALVFVATTLLQNLAVQQIAITSVAIWVLAIVWVACTLYIVWCNFSTKQSLKKILVASSCNSATTTNHRVVGKTIAKCAHLVQGVKLKKYQLSTDEKHGFVLNLAINYHGKDVAFATEKLRCLLVDAFASTLGVAFNTITFEICKFSTTYTPNVEQAHRTAEQLAQDAEQTAQQSQCNTCTAEEKTDPLPSTDTPQPTSETD